MPIILPRAIAHFVRFAIVALVAAAAPTLALGAQQPGAPVLQNGFANNGLTAALNYSTGQDTKLLGAAVAFGRGSIQLSLGAGRLSIDSEGDELDPLTTYGARVALPRWGFMNGRIGVAPFVGVGGASGDSVSTLIVPLGVGAGWRMALGSTRALSVYGTASYLFGRVTPEGGDAEMGNLLRFAVAADVTLFRNVGFTIGSEFGAAADEDLVTLPQGSVLGLGLSWAFR